MSADEVIKWASLVISFITLAGFVASWLSISSVVANANKQPLKTDTEISKNAIETARGANEIAVSVQAQMKELIADKDFMQAEIDELKEAKNNLMDDNRNLIEKLRIRDLEITRLAKRVTELEDIIKVRKNKRE